MTILGGVSDMAERIAQSFVQESEHKYEKFMLGVDFDRDKMLEMFPTARTFPQIVITEVDNDGHPVFETEVAKSIGGYTEYEALVSKL